MIWKLLTAPVFSLGEGLLMQTLVLISCWLLHKQSRLIDKQSRLLKSWNGMWDQFFDSSPDFRRHVESRIGAEAAKRLRGTVGEVKTGSG